MAAAALLVIGVGAATMQILPAFGGFLMMVFGLGLALIGIVTSIVGVVATAPGKRREGRRLALRGLALSIAVLVVVMVAASKGQGLPRINDITTNVDDPPVFVTATKAPPNQDRDMNYPGASFAFQQHQAYPDLATLVTHDSPGAAFEHVHSVLSSLPRTQITGEDRTDGRIEATETSRIFHFSDDVVVRIRPNDGGGSRVDIRSKSRDGQGDLGVNAARIRTILARLRNDSPPPGD
jgi:uncharacterized protein (DUF1499 family)